MEIPHHTLGLNVSFARGVAVCDAATFLVTSEVLAGLTKYPQYFRLNLPGTPDTPDVDRDQP
jgi:SUMO ligase MMS21 Smc5/6 complex component